MTDVLHRDVVENLWGAALQHRLKKVSADAPYEGDTSGTYRFTTDPHTDADCLFESRATEYIGIVYEPLPEESWERILFPKTKTEGARESDGPL